jgi:hypothetical protein
MTVDLKLQTMTPGKQILLQVKDMSLVGLGRQIKFGRLMLMVLPLGEMIQMLFP